MSTAGRHGHPGAGSPGGAPTSRHTHIPGQAPTVGRPYTQAHRRRRINTVGGAHAAAPHHTNATHSLRPPAPHPPHTLTHTHANTGPRGGTRPAGRPGNPHITSPTARALLLRPARHAHWVVNYRDHGSPPRAHRAAAQRQPHRRPARSAPPENLARAPCPPSSNSSKAAHVDRQHHRLLPAQGWSEDPRSPRQIRAPTLNLLRLTGACIRTRRLQRRAPSSAFPSSDINPGIVHHQRPSTSRAPSLSQLHDMKCLPRLLPSTPAAHA